MEVNHRDGDIENNHWTNLEYVTRSENIRHALKHGLIPSGERAHRAKPSDEDVDALRAAYAAGVKYGQLAERYRISRQHAWLLATKRCRP